MSLQVQVRAIARCPYVVLCTYYPSPKRRKQMPLFSELRAGFRLQPLQSDAKFLKFLQILDQFTQQSGLRVRKFLKEIPFAMTDHRLSAQAVAVAFWVFIAEPLPLDHTKGQPFHQAVHHILTRINQVVGTLEAVCTIEALLDRDILIQWLAPKVQTEHTVLLAPPPLQLAMRPIPLSITALDEVLQFSHVPTTEVVPHITYQPSDDMMIQLGFTHNQQPVGLPVNWEVPLLIIGGSTKTRAQLASYLMLECYQNASISHIFVIDDRAIFNGLVHVLSPRKVQEWRLGQNLSLDLSHMPNCENTPSERASWLSRLLFGAAADAHLSRHQSIFEERVRTLDEQTTFQEIYDRLVARDAEQRYVYAETRSFLNVFQDDHHQITSPPLGNILRSNPITILQPGSQPELVKRYLQLYWLLWLVVQAPVGSVVVLDRVEALIPQTKGQQLREPEQLFEDLLLEAERRNIRLVFLSATYWIAPTLLTAAENRVYLRLASEREQLAVLAAHALTDPSAKLTLQAGRQALFVHEQAPNQGVFFAPASIHPLYGRVQVNPRLNPLDKLPPPQRERSLRPDQYAVVMTVLPELATQQRLSDTQLENLLQSVCEPGTNLLVQQSLLTSTHFLEQIQVGGVISYTLTDAGREYYRQQMQKIQTWPSALDPQTLQTTLEAFGDYADQLELPLSVEDQNALTQLGLQLLATAHAFLGHYPWALIQEFYTLLQHPTPQGFVGWYSNYQVAMRHHLFVSLPHCSVQTPQEDADLEQVAEDEDVVVTRLSPAMYQKAEAEFSTLVEENSAGTNAPVSEIETPPPSAPRPPEHVFQKKLLEEYLQGSATKSSSQAPLSSPPKEDTRSAALTFVRETEIRKDPFTIDQSGEEDE